MERFLKQKRGYTLVELLVAMGIFSVILTLFTGFFVVLVRLQSAYRATADLQQEARIVSEVFTRYAREASYVGFDPADPSFIEFELPRGTSKDQSIWVRFISYGDGMLRMYISPDGSFIPPGQPITLSSIVFTDFSVSRENSVVYPKVLKYEFKMAKKINGAASTNPGDQILFRGYINMRNEQ